MRTAPPAVNAKLASACHAYHDLPELVEAKRAGYGHFERSHRIVLDRDWHGAGRPESS
ncbi:MAG: hypothetical protein R2729_22445 [Bryobacteraceae bacterium]